MWRISWAAAASSCDNQPSADEQQGAGFGHRCSMQDERRFDGDAGWLLTSAEAIPWSNQPRLPGEWTDASGVQVDEPDRVHRQIVRNACLRDESVCSGTETL
jgi:hypothetical protein